MAVFSRVTGVTVGLRVEVWRNPWRKGIKGNKYTTPLGEEPKKPLKSNIKSALYLKVVAGVCSSHRVKTEYTLWTEAGPSEDTHKHTHTHTPLISNVQNLYISKNQRIKA